MWYYYTEDNFNVDKWYYYTVDNSNVNMWYYYTEDNSNVDMWYYYTVDNSNIDMWYYYTDRGDGEVTPRRGAARGQTTQKSSIDVIPLILLVISMIIVAVIFIVKYVNFFCFLLVCGVPWHKKVNMMISQAEEYPTMHDWEV